MIDNAIMFATLAHNGQKRKGSHIPYIMHPIEAGVIASEMVISRGAFDENIVCAAILHDTYEDAKVKYETLETMFNKEVADLVESQSEDKSKSWKERKQHTIEYLLQEKNEDIKIVSLSDKLANIRSIKKDYDELGEELWQRFNEKMKSEHKWYYSSLVECFKELQGFQAYKEYKELVAKVFGE